MKTVSVLGANGLTARHVVEQLQHRGDKVVAISGEADDLRDTGADIVNLDFSTATVDDLVLALIGSDAVVDAAGSVTSVDAAQIAGVKRYVQVTPAARPRQLQSVHWDELFAARRAADRNLRASSLDWTILESGRLDNGRPTGLVALGAHSDDAIARADVAAAVLAALDDDRTIGHAWELTGGDTRIEDAIDHLV
jgi:uncharacterized protein YbjT (DUF2867 family)